jgi:aminopeptidase N
MLPFKFALASLLLSALWVLSARAQPQAGVDVQHYVFRLTLTDASDRIAGEADVTVQFTGNVAAELRLDLVGKVQTGQAGMIVSGVRRNGQPVQFTHADDVLLIPLGTQPPGSEKQVFKVTYVGVPADGLVISKNKFGDRTFFGDNWPNRARHWLPVADHPSDKSTCEFIVTAPDHYRVISNGLLKEETGLPGNLRRTHWVEAVPIPTKVMVVGASRFAVQHVDTLRNVPVQSWVYPQDRDAGFFDYAPAAPILVFFDSLVGPYPYEKLANVQSKTRYGGMENAGNIFYNEKAIHGKKNLDMERLVAHEIGHQWFGNSVTEKDWPHVWLSEGFATYLADVYVEHAYGPSRMAEYLQKERKEVFDFAKENPSLPVVVAQPADLMALLNPNSYQKGAWTLHMLRQQVGDDAFWRGLRTYYGRYRNANAATEDFRKVMEEASGKDLAGFFKQWLHTPGYPRLTGTWAYDPTQKELVVQFRQQAGANYAFPLALGLYDTAGKLLSKETVQMDGAEKTFRIKVDSVPANVVPDPDTEVLAEVALKRR